MQVERQQTEPSSVLASGARVSNAYMIYLSVEDSPGKLGLMPHVIQEWHHFWIKDPSLRDERAYY